MLHHGGELLRLLQMVLSTDIAVGLELEECGEARDRWVVRPNVGGTCGQ